MNVIWHTTIAPYSGTLQVTTWFARWSEVTPERFVRHSMRWFQQGRYL